MSRTRRGLLVVGDLLTLALVTVIGFMSHGTLSSAGSRIWTTILPVSATWLLIAPSLGLFQAEPVHGPGYWWRLVLGTVYSVSLATILRSLWLGGTVIPVFALVMMATSLLGILIWRFIWELYTRRR